MAQVQKCSYLGNCTCPKCKDILTKEFLPRIDFDAGEGGYIPMKSDSPCTFLNNCQCGTCVDILNPLQEYIAAFMDRRPVLPCTGLAFCICMKCDPSGEGAFKHAEDMAERIALLASSEKSSLMRMLVKTGPTAKFEKKLAEAYSEEMRKTAKRMKKDLELRKKYVFDGAGDPDFETFEAPSNIVVPPENESNSAGFRSEPPQPTKEDAEAAAAAAAIAAAVAEPEPEPKVVVVEKEEIPEFASPAKKEEEEEDEEPGPLPRRVGSTNEADAESIPKLRKETHVFPEQTEGGAAAAGGAAEKKKGGLFFLLPKKLGKFKFAQRGREILWMRNLRPVMLKGDKVAYPKLESVTMVICNDIMFLGVHQTQITDSQTYVLVHRPTQRDEVRAEELNPELGGVYFRIFLGKQEFIVQATSKTEMTYWVRTINQRRGFKPTSQLVSMLG